MSAMIFGCQRFVTVSTGLAVNKSSSQEETAATMPWLTGELIDVWPSQRDASYIDGRRLTSDGSPAVNNGTVDEDGLPQQLALLLNHWSALAVAITISVIVHLSVTWYWRRRMNAKFYSKETLLFVPFPKMLVWPNVPVFLISCFATGLCNAAVSIVAAAPAGCSVACPTLGAATLVLLALFVVFLVTGVMRVRSKHGPHIPWSVAHKAATPTEVDDPLMALRAQCYAALQCGVWDDQSSLSSSVEKLASPSDETVQRTQLCENANDAHEQVAVTQLRFPEDFGKQASQAPGMRFAGRLAGEFHIPPEDLQEPERTERLLAMPFALDRARAGDAHHQHAGIPDWDISSNHSRYAGA